MNAQWTRTDGRLQVVDAQWRFESRRRRPRPRRRHRTRRRPALPCPAPVAVIMSSLWRFVCHGHWPGSSPDDRCHLPNWPPLTGDSRCRPSGMAAKPRLALTPPMYCRRNETVYLYSLSAFQAPGCTASLFNFLHIFEDSRNPVL